MSKLNHALTAEMIRFDKIVEWCEHHTGMTFPELIEKDDRIYIKYSNGESFMVKEYHECEDVAAVRLSIQNDNLMEIVNQIES